VSGRLAAAGLAAALVFLPGATGAAPAAAPLAAGATSLEVALPHGPPLAGYGGFPRRAWIPDVLDRAPHAFWFRPSEGVHDPLTVRALVLEAEGRRLLWLAVDLVGTDPSLLQELRRRLDRRGVVYTAVVVSASHTHSGPGAYADSALFAFAALDRLSPAVRTRILDGLEQAALGAEAARGPARFVAGRTEVRGITRSRLGAALDPELGVLGVTRPGGRPVAVVWNYAIHPTALGKHNRLLSGDLPAEAAARIERALGAPALFVNGAVGDVSPRDRGRAGAARAGAALAAGVLEAWRRAEPDPAASIAVVSERVTLPSPALSLRNCLGRWVPRGMRLGLGEALPSATEVLAVATGRTAWVVIPGELETRLGVEVKAAGRARWARTWIAGVSNDYLGYFLTPEAYARPSYIACASLYGAEGGLLLRRAAEDALRRLAGRVRTR
jgi:hypothetical protein